MWRDELQAWLIARDSPTISALLQNLRYEGHPALWYLLLMPLTRLSRNPEIMQGLNLAIAAATVAIVMWRAPLYWIERTLFPFGYFMLYEYGVKSRSYALGFLLVMVLCVSWPKRRKHPVLIASVLALLANVHLLLLVLSIAAVCALALDRVPAIGATAERPYAGWRSNLMAACIVLAGWAMAILTIRPAPDCAVAPTWYFSVNADRIDDTFGIFSGLFAPFPSSWTIAASILILLMIALRWKAAPQAAVFYLLSLAGMLTLFYVRIPSTTWLRGILFVSFVATNWLSRNESPLSTPGATPKQLIPRFVFCIVLALQVPPGFMALKADLLQPLSSGQAVARYLKARGWANQPIIGVPDYIMTPIVGYLGADRFYYSNAQRWGSFTVWDQRRHNPIDMNKFLESAAALGPQETLIVGVLTPVDPQVLSQYGFNKVAQFTGAGTPDENYDLYRRGGTDLGQIKP